MKPAASTILTQDGRRNAMMPSSILVFRFMYSAMTPVLNATRLLWARDFLASRALGRRETMNRARSCFLIISDTRVVLGSGFAASLNGKRNAQMEDGLVSLNGELEVLNKSKREGGVLQMKNRDYFGECGRFVIRKKASKKLILIELIHSTLRPLELVQANKNYPSST